MQLLTAAGTLAAAEPDLQPQVAGGAIGTPAGVFLQRMIVTEMGRGTGYHLPASILDVFGPVELVLYRVGGLAIAVLGALLPAGWAARTRTATALRTE